MTEEPRRKLNQFGDEDDTSNMTTGDWNSRWEKGQTNFHVENVHPTLEKFYNRITQGKANLRFYLPLCGKSVDIKWLVDRGHTVVGSEGSDLACRQFFEENSIPYKTFTVPNFSDILGEFDCIWDRGSFVAIPVDKRSEYSNLILPSLKKGGLYLLDLFTIQSDYFVGPPFNSTEEDVRNYFGDKCTIEKLETNDVFTDKQKDWGMNLFEEVVYLLALK